MKKIIGEASIDLQPEFQKAFQITKDIQKLVKQLEKVDFTIIDEILISINEKCVELEVKGQNEKPLVE